MDKVNEVRQYDRLRSERLNGSDGSDEVRESDDDNSDHKER